MTPARLMVGLALALALAPVAAEAQHTDAEAAELVEALAIHEGSTVAEIGAGSGAMTLKIAKYAGAAGRVFSTELGDERVAALRRAIEAGPAANVTVVAGDPTRTNLPEQCCDALFMQNVYHHFGDPSAMNASLLASLKPGGRIAVTDFPPDGTEAADPKARGEKGHHGVTAATVKRELEAAGFTSVTITARGGRDVSFLVSGQKPATAAAAASPAPASAAAAATASSAAPDWSIRIQSSGGFAGRGAGGVAVSADDTVQIFEPGPPQARDTPACTLKLTADQRASVERALAAARPEAWSARYAPPNNPQGCCDMFQWTLTLTRAARDGSSAMDTRRVSWVDEGGSTAMPEDLRALAQAVLALKPAHACTTDR